MSTPALYSDPLMLVTSTSCGRSSGCFIESLGHHWEFLEAFGLGSLSTNGGVCTAWECGQPLGLAAAPQHHWTRLGGGARRQGLAAEPVTIAGTNHEWAPEVLQRAAAPAAMEVAAPG